MSIAYAVLAVLLALALVLSGRAKLAKDEKVTSVITALGVPASWLAWLAAAEIAGALGLLIGIGWRPLGVAAAVGVVAYFVGAVITHLRVKDVKGVPAAGILTVAAAVVVVLGAATV
ncbi:DoxX family protein [Streptomyces chartreusis]|uniref:DoxX family protein n=1 Tax=Streptomyces chartreusis TaxID=1969 RepID=UPI0036AE5F20